MEYKAGFDNILETKGCGEYYRVIMFEDLNTLSNSYYNYNVVFAKAKESIMDGLEVIEFVNGGYIHYDSNNKPIEMIEVALVYIDEEGETCELGYAEIPNGSYFDNFHC